MSKVNMYDLLEELEREGAEFMAFSIETPVNRELIVVRSEFARKKCEYIDLVYDDNLVMKSNSFISIKAVSIGSLDYIMDEIEEILPDTEDDTDETSYY